MLKYRALHLDRLFWCCGNTSYWQHMQLATRAKGNTYNWQHVQLAIPATGNTCKWQHVWTDQLDVPAVQTSWTDQLNGPAGRTSWTDQLDRPAGRTSSLFLKPWPVRIFKDFPFSLYTVSASESGKRLGFFMRNHAIRKPCYIAFVT